MEGRAGVAGGVPLVDRPARGVLLGHRLTVLPDRLRHLVDQFLIGIGGSDQVHRTDVEARIVLRQIGIGVGRNHGELEEGVVPGELLPLLFVEGEEADVVGAAGLGDRSGRHRAAKEGGIDRTVAQHIDRAALRAIDLGEVVVGHAVGGQ